MSITTVQQLKTLIKEAVEDANNMNDNQYNFTIPPKEVVQKICYGTWAKRLFVIFTTKKIWRNFVRSMNSVDNVFPKRLNMTTERVIWNACMDVFNQQLNIVVDITKDLTRGQAKTIQLPFKKNSAEELVYELLFNELKQYAIDQNKFKATLMSCISARKNDFDKIDAQIESKYPEIFSKLKQVLSSR